MRVLFYCQHVLGMGHLFRALSICRALAGHEVTLVSGGPGGSASLPGHVRLFSLPALSMDAEFSGLQTDGGLELEEVKAQRKERLARLVRDFSPDVFLVELFPFGRKAFSFELLPALEVAHGLSRPPLCASSVRDILVEKSEPSAYEDRVVRLVNQWFGLVLVHADPRVVRLSETFSREADFACPVEYTGYVARKPGGTDKKAVRERFGLLPEDRLVVVSAGGGAVGGALLAAAVDAAPVVNAKQRVYVVVSAGPYLPEKEYAALADRAGPGVLVRRFVRDFPGLVAAADLSVSMGGYNTCMDVLAAGVPALVWPFGRNREQGLRAEKLAAMGALGVLSDEDLAPKRLAQRMLSALEAGAERATVDLSGAERTARLLERYGGDA
ncbi:MAG: glycosyl transferase [Deltaproteobacteria bacterium]|nr:glycosyl transferase [Deltaproteobacteria bacterium]